MGLAGQQGVQRSPAELCALTSMLHWSTAWLRVPGAAARHGWAQQGRTGGQAWLCGSCSGVPKLLVQGRGLRSCWPHCSLPAGAVAGAAGSQAQDQARHFHGAHRPQVPAAVVPGECWARREPCGHTAGAQMWHPRSCCQAGREEEEERLRQPPCPGTAQGSGSTLEHWQG